MRMIKNDKKLLTVLKVASSVLWGGIGSYVTVVFAWGVLTSFRTKHLEFIGSEVVILLGGIALILAAIFIWSRQRGVRWLVGMFSCLSSILILLSLVWAAAAGHWPPLFFYFALIIPLIGILLSVLSLVCLPPKNKRL
jgi:hypothetical protein